VDDDREGREMMATLLEFNGHVVKQAADTQTALALARMRPRARLDGFDDAGDGRIRGRTALKADPRTAKAILIAVSGRVFALDVRRAFHSGFEGFLAKPVDVEKTQQVIAALMRDGRAALPLLLLLPRQPLS
jgi:CheY-like chemotaxis protein